MTGGRMHTDGDALVRGLLLAGFALGVYAAVESGQIRHYLNPAYLRFVIPAGWVLGVMSLVQLAGAFRRLPPGVRMAVGRPGPSTLVYAVFAVTLGVGLTLNPVTLGADVVERQGLNLGQRARQGAVVLTPGGGVGGTTAWLGSGFQGLALGAQSLAPPRLVHADPELVQGGEDDDAAGQAPDGPEGEAGGEAWTDTGSEPLPPGDDGFGEPFDGSYDDPLFDPYAGVELDDSDIEGNRLVIDERNFFARVWDLWINPDEYAGMEIELTGFVAHFSEFEDNQMMVARLVVVCHVAHAMPDGFIVNYERAEDLAEDTWVKVVGSMEKGKIQEFDVLLMNVSQLEIVPVLSDPYIYPPGFDAEDFAW